MDAEIRMITDIAAVAPKELRFNYQEVKEFLTTTLKGYESLVVTEDEISSAKEIRAKCNKLVKTIGEYRISIKKQLLQEYDGDFKPKCDELAGMAQQVSDHIGKQLAAFDERRKTEKFAALERYFQDNIGDMAPYLTFEQVKNLKWGNATFAIENAQAEIKQAIDMCADGVNAIRSLNSEFEPALLNAYAKTHDLAGAMKLNGELIEQKRREDERKAALEAAKTAAGREEVQTVQRMAERKKVQEPPPVEADKLYSLTLQFWGTQAQLVKLRQYLDDAGIRFKKVE